MPEDNSISLADLIYQLRSDLSLAAWQGEQRSPKFEVGPIELEVSVVVDSARSGSITAKLVLVDASAGANKTSHSTHRIKLTLQPIDEHGRKSQVSGQEIDNEEGSS